MAENSVAPFKGPATELLPTKPPVSQIIKRLVIGNSHCKEILCPLYVDVAEVNKIESLWGDTCNPYFSNSKIKDDRMGTP